MRRFLKALAGGFLLISLFGLYGSAAHPELPAGTRLWMCHRTASELSDSASWRTLYRYADTIHIYIDVVNTARLSNLRALAEVINAANIEVSVELAGLANWHADKVDGSGNSLTAERSYETEYAKLALWLTPVEQGGAGGRIDHLCFDGAFRRCLYPDGASAGNPGYHTIESTAQEFVEMMELWKSGKNNQNIALPNVSFRLYENLPHWGFIHSDGTIYPAYHEWNATGMGILGQGDIGAVIDAVLEAQATSDASLKGIQIDHPYDYYIKRHTSNHPAVIEDIDFKQRLLDLETFVEDRGLEFGLTFNSQLGGQTSGKQFHDETLAYLEEHLALGSTPKVINIQSWYEFPVQYLPESQPYTLGYTARKALGLAWPEKLDGWYFEEDANMEGWSTAGGTTGAAVNDGKLSATATAEDTLLLRDGLSLNASHISAYQVVVAASENCLVSLAWTTTDEPIFTNENQVIVSCTGNGSFQTLLFPLSESQGWNGKEITALRLRLELGSGESFQVEQILPVYTPGDELLNLSVSLQKQEPLTNSYRVEFFACKGFGYRLYSQSEVGQEHWTMELDTGLINEDQDFQLMNTLNLPALFFAIGKYRP